LLQFTINLNSVGLENALLRILTIYGSNAFWRLKKAKINAEQARRLEILTARLRTPNLSLGVFEQSQERLAVQSPPRLNFGPFDQRSRQCSEGIDYAQAVPQPGLSMNSEGQPKNLK
jgi:hypothetical protein